jgi:DNA-binding NarL/FixJ family response regulator
MVLPLARPQIRVSLAAPDFLSLAGLHSYFVAQNEMVVLGDQEQEFSDVLLVGADLLGPEVLASLREAATRTNKPMVLIVNDLPEDVLPAVLRCGVSVVLLRDSADGERVRQGVRIAAAGGGFLPPRLFGLLINHLGQLDRAVATGRTPSANQPAGREVEVLRLLADGWDSADIAEVLGSSERTVKNVFQAIKHRYELRNRPHAVAYALRAGWI